MPSFPAFKLRSMTWMGGKYLTGPFIKHNLPWSSRQAYIEPFAGMLSVLLNRDPVAIEIVNDANDRICNFWQVLRDNHDQLVDKLRKTPWAKDEFVNCIRTLDEGCDVERARKFVAVCIQSMIKTENSKPYNWTLETHGGSVKRRMFCEHGHADKLAQRIENMQIENADACKFLERLFLKEWDNREVLIYCDPPYRNATKESNSEYAASLDFDSFKSILKAAPEGIKIAISGYHGDYDDLGWRKETLDWMLVGGGRKKGSMDSELNACG